MVWFEVFIPGKDATHPSVTLTVEAQNWIGALRTGLSNLGEGHEAIANVMCDIKEDNSIHVTDVATQRVFRLREVPAPTKAPAKAAASSSPPPEATVPSQRAPGPPRPVSMPEIPRDALDEPLGDATIPNPISVKDLESSIPWTKMAAPTEVVSPTIELKASMPPPAMASTAAPKVTQMMFRAEVKPSDVTVPSQPVPQPPPPSTSARPTPAPIPMPPTGPSTSKPTPAPVPAAKPTPAATPASQPVPSFQAPPTKAVTQPTPTTAPPAQPSVPPAASTFEAAPATSQEVPSKKPKKRQQVEETERIERAAPGITGPLGAALGAVAVATEAVAKRTGPVAAPTPRGTPAPPPKRTTGQFDGSPQPITRETSMETPKAPIGRQEPVNAQAVADAVADVFDATQDLLMESDVNPKDIAEKLLDIALQHVPAESGSFFLADLNGHELQFAAVRGPKASEIQKKKLSVKVGQGIVGFCALEGVCLSVSDIQKDPRYFSAVADAVGYSPKDTLCASAEKDGRLFGALQLINSRGGFTPAHMEVLRYIGLTAASLLERHFDRH